ncbi:MAG TPA: ATP-binding protein [Acidimicrobiales bacterium]|nr:ATP-binding protein [Acidimicrobiales bacterium]
MKALAALAARLSLRVRLTVLSALGAALVLPLVVLLLQGAVRDALNDAVTAELRVRADDVAAELGAGVTPVVTDGLVTQVLAPDGTVVRPDGADPLVGSDELPERAGDELVRDRAVPAVGEHTRVLARRLTARAGGGWVVVAGSTSPIVEVERRLAVLLGVAGPLLVLAVAATAWMLTRSALQPVRRMTRRASTISLEEPRERLPQPPGGDEIAELGRTLNGMLDRIEQTVAHERAFVDDASHELRTPIAVLRGELELARMELAAREPGDPLRAIDSALEETDRLARITEHLLVLARADAGRLADTRERVSLMTATAHVIDRVDAGNVQLQVTGVEGHVVADPDLVDQLLTNLVGNAVRFARTTVRVGIRIEGDAVVVEVDDDGPGFDPAVLDRALDRFSRSGTSRTRSGGGAGLGLAIVAAIVDSLDGQIELENDGLLGGATVTVHLPRASRPG